MVCTDEMWVSTLGNLRFGGFCSSLKLAELRNLQWFGCLLNALNEFFSFCLILFQVQMKEYMSFCLFVPC